MRRVCRSPAFGRPVAPEKQIRGEYPTVAQSLADARCLAQAAWSTPLTRRKAERMFKRMRARLVEDEAYIDRKRRLQNMDFVIMPGGCNHQSAACYNRKHNTIYVESYTLTRRAPLEPFDPKRGDLTHGLLLHELAHAMTPVVYAPSEAWRQSARKCVAEDIEIPEPRLRRQVHGKDFARNLGRVARIWCETEGSKVCDYYCPDWRKIVAKKPPWQAE